MQSGRLRALAVSTATRNQAAPELPTMAEAGVKGRGLMVPAATPAPVVKRVQRKTPSGEHGQRFHYDNATPEALAWGLKRACGAPLSELMSSRVFAPLGCERDGSYTVDATGAEARRSGSP